MFISKYYFSGFWFKVRVTAFQCTFFCFSQHGQTRTADRIIRMKQNLKCICNSFLPELVLKVRIANSDEKDFIEIELPHTHLNFSGLLNLMCAELGVDKSLVAKIRKLPDTIVRKDKDVRRLKDLQELELVLTNKAISASSRTYSLGPARNNETILY